MVIRKPGGGEEFIWETDPELRWRIELEMEPVLGLVVSQISITSSSPSSSSSEWREQLERLAVRMESGNDVTGK